MDKTLEALLLGIKHNIESRTQNTNLEAEKDPRHTLAENSVTKEHALSRAYYRFGLVEKRCMEAMVSKLNPLRCDNPQEIELRALDYAQTFNVSEKLAYRDLTSAVNGLMHTVISAQRPGGKKGRVSFTVMSKAEYMEDEGRIVCVFNPLIVPYLLGMRGRFASYPLKTAVDFSSSYTWRFYELLVSWAQSKDKTRGLFAGWFSVEVDELRAMLGVPEAYNWGMFNERVLSVAMEELREKASIHMTVTQHKTGRKITHLKIEFIQSDQLEMLLDDAEQTRAKRKKPL